MGKTAHDIVQGLGNLGSAKATTIARAQTGVDPGYDPFTGYALTEDGRIRSRGARAGRLVGLAVCGASSAVNVAQGASVRLPFGTAAVGAVTTGAAAYITVATTGWYEVTCGLFMRGANVAYSAGDFFDVYVHRQDTNASLGVIAYQELSPGTYRPEPYLHGKVYLELTAGLGIYLKAENQCSSAGNATAPTSSTDFFAVSYA